MKGYGMRMSKIFIGQIILAVFLVLILVVIYITQVSPLNTFLNNITKFTLNQENAVLNLPTTNSTTRYILESVGFTNAMNLAQNLLVATTALLGLFGVIYIEIMKDKEIHGLTRVVIYILGITSIGLLAIALFGIISIAQGIGALNPSIQAIYYLNNIRSLNYSFNSSIVLDISTTALNTANTDTTYIYISILLTVLTILIYVLDRNYHYER